MLQPSRQPKKGSTRTNLFGVEAGFEEQRLLGSALGVADGWLLTQSRGIRKLGQEGCCLGLGRGVVRSPLWCKGNCMWE